MRFVVVLLVFLMGILMPMTAVAATIRITTQGNEPGAAPQAPQNFDAEAVSDYEILVTWTTGLNAVNTLVVRKIGSYPADRTDGVQVYYGTAENVTDGVDMSLLDQDVYYRAWSENAGLWSLDYAEDFVRVEGAMTNALMMFSIIILCLGLTISGLHYRQWIITGIACLLWWGFAYWAYQHSTADWDIYWFMSITSALMGFVTAASPLFVRKEQPELRDVNPEDNALNRWEATQKRIERLRNMRRDRD